MSLLRILKEVRLSSRAGWPTATRTPFPLYPPTPIAHPTNIGCFAATVLRPAQASALPRDWLQYIRAMLVFRHRPISRYGWHSLCMLLLRGTRSEERRVGKECRAGGAAERLR